MFILQVLQENLRWKKKTNIKQQPEISRATDIISRNYDQVYSNS